MTINACISQTSKPLSREKYHNTERKKRASDLALFLQPAKSQVAPEGRTHRENLVIHNDKRVDEVPGEVRENRLIALSDTQQVSFDTNIQVIPGKILFEALTQLFYQFLVAAFLLLRNEQIEANNMVIFTHEIKVVIAESR